jgi:hypothetical protein
VVSTVSGRFSPRSAETAGRFPAVSHAGFLAENRSFFRPSTPHVFYSGIHTGRIKCQSERTSERGLTGVPERRVSTCQKGTLQRERDVR